MDMDKQKLSDNELEMVAGAAAGLSHRKND
jgi:hypothetical protein